MGLKFASEILAFVSSVLFLVWPILSVLIFIFIVRNMKKRYMKLLYIAKHNPIRNLKYGRKQSDDTETKGPDDQRKPSEVETQSTQQLSINSPRSSPISDISTDNEFHPLIMAEDKTQISPLIQTSSTQDKSTPEILND